jgi:hypothetical protein
MNNNKHIVIVHRKWMGEQEFTSYTHEFDSYTEAMAQVYRSVHDIANHLTLVTRHEARVEYVSPHPEFAEGKVIVLSVDSSTPSVSQA